MKRVGGGKMKFLMTAVLAALAQTAWAQEAAPPIPITAPAPAAAPAASPPPAASDVTAPVTSAPASAEAEKKPDVKPEEAKKQPEPASAPSAAEMAIVQNAEVLNTLSPPVDGGDGGQSGTQRVTDILADPATVRPLPQKYLVVKKDHGENDADARLTAARLALTRGRDQAALELFDELYKEDPLDARVLMGRAVALQRLGQTEDAIGAYEVMLSRDPENIEAMTNMLGLLKGQDPEMAVERLRRLRQSHPANADITAQLGTMYGMVGDYKNALQYLDMADSLKPGHPGILYNKAIVYDRMGKAGEAGEIYRELLRRSAAGTMGQTNLPIETIRKRLSVLR